MTSSEEEDEQEAGDEHDCITFPCTASGCNLVLSSRHQQRMHYRAVHQSTLVWQRNGTQESITVHRDKGFFYCPFECGFKHQLPREFQRHQDCTRFPRQTEAQEELAERYNMKIEQETRVLICSRCQIGVPKAEAADHLQKEHNVSDNDVNRLGTLLTVLNPLASLAVKFDHAVPGIAVRDGYQCPHCSEYCCLKVKSLQKHCREKHQGLQVPPNNYPGCRVQSLNGVRNWYGVSAAAGREKDPLPAELQQLAQTARDQLAAVSGVAGQVSDDASGSFLKIHVLEVYPWIQVGFSIAPRIQLVWRWYQKWYQGSKLGSVVPS